MWSGPAFTAIGHQNLHFFLRKKIADWHRADAGGQKPCVESSSKGGSFSPKNDGHVRPAQTFMLTISDPSLAGLRSNVLDNHRSGCFLSAN